MAFHVQLTNKHIQQLDSKVNGIIKPLHNERLSRMLKELAAEVRYHADLEDESVLGERNCSDDELAGFKANVPVFDDNSECMDVGADRCSVCFY